MLPKNISVSVRKEVRRLSSKSGNSLGSGAKFFRFRRYSHCAAKLLESAWDRGSASILRTWLSSVAGSLSLLAAARFNSSSSGRLLHKKYERREASSRSSIL